MSELRLNITKTKDIRKPTYYVDALMGEFSQYAFDEVRAPEFKGQWRERVFAANLNTTPMDVEIGTGNGYFFAHQAIMQPNRLLVGIELKFKPLIQSIRRALRADAKNARAVRFNASFIDSLFAQEEINNVYIHHPDPWTRRRKQKHRLLTHNFLKKLILLQRPGSFLDFKTDSEEYFRWTHKEFLKSCYQVTRYSENLQKSEWSGENFTTHFEKLFLAKGQSIFYLRAEKAIESQ